jgi:hypothetical protein
LPNKIYHNIPFFWRRVLNGAQTSTDKTEKGMTMESMDIPNSDGEQRPSKRIRKPTQPYKAGPANQAGDYLLEEEERMLAQAIANSRKDRGIETNMVSTIPFGPTFYPTVEEFSGDPLAYLETIRSEAEKYGEFWKISFPQAFPAKDTSP